MQVGQQASQQHEWMAVCSRGSWQASLCSIGIGCDVRAPYGSAMNAVIVSDAAAKADAAVSCGSQRVP